MDPSRYPIASVLTQPVKLDAMARAMPDRWPFLLNSFGEAAVSSARWSLLLRSAGEPIVEPKAGQRDFLLRLQQAISAGNRFQEPFHLPFCGGFFVYFGYEAVSEVEPILELPLPIDLLPIAYAVPCPAALIYDHWTESCWLVGEDQDAYNQAFDEIESARNSLTEYDQLNNDPNIRWSVSVDAPTIFESSVRQIQDYIGAGDVFQVNLSRLWQAKSEDAIDPMIIYQALLRANPAPFSGLARLPGGTIVSSSPERLVLKRGGQVETRPIAGTRPRGKSASEDQALMAQLFNHPKERAEHIMLIDLERNDLGRVCRSGSVRVDELMGIETYEHVHHIVSNIKGEVLPGTTATDIIRAVFPGGTITGCPKVRCMEIIAELEQVGRSFYTGSMGYISHDGGMDLNILIRSMLVSDHELCFRTGAGIVADSDATAEVAETEAKARGLLRALGLDVEHVK